jgi:hypothetical protein
MEDRLWSRLIETLLASGDPASAAAACTCQAIAWS